MIGRTWVLLFCAVAACAQWPQFRGPSGRGVAEASNPPTDIGPTKNVAWRTELPPGHSSPIIAAGRIFLTAAEPTKSPDKPGRLLTISLDLQTGKILWQRESPRPRVERSQAANSAASPTPVSDGKNVYVFFGDFGVLAYDIAGNERWKLPLGPFNNQNGHGSSPVLVDDLLVLLCDQDTGSYLVAVNKDTGQVKWKADRPEATRSYSTPGVLRTSTGGVELIIPGAYQLTSYDARTGEKLWWITGLSWQPKSTPIIDGNMIYAHWWENGGEAETPTETPEFSETLARFDANGDKKISPEEFASDPRMQRGFGDNDLDKDGFVDERDWKYYRARRAARNALLAVRHGGKGDLTDSLSILWRMQKFLPNAPSPLLHNGVLFLIKDGGILTSVDAKTGKIIKQGRMPGALDTYYSSPVTGGGHLYVVSQSGKMTVLTAQGEWDVVASADLGEDCFATPAILKDALYVRTRAALYCFRNQPRSATRVE